jgi:hypothetical protein
MSEATTPKGLRKEDVEKGMIGKVAELPYLPLVDEKGAAEANEKGSRVEVKLPNDTKIYLQLCRHSANKEQFLTQVISYKNTIVELGLHHAYEKTITTLELCDKIMMKNFYDPDSEETVDPAKKDKFDRALKSHTKAEARKTDIVKKMFATFSSFLDESIRPVYTEIVTTKVNVAPWVNLRGEEQTTPLSYTVEAFEMCTLFWLRTVFQQDAAEQLLLYIQHHLKKSRKQSLRMFVARVKQLNNYVPHLPGVYFTSKATSNTVPANKLDEPGLAGLVLRMCPPSWQQQHNLIRNEIPQDLERLVQFLEQQEAMDSAAKPTTNPKDNSRKNGQAKKQNGSEHSGRNKKKFKSSNKHCDLCTKKGGPKGSHNTAKCRKWNPDGTKKKYQGKSNDGKTQVNYTQFKELQDDVKDLVKTVKRNMKRSQGDADCDSDA